MEDSSRNGQKKGIQAGNEQQSEIKKGNLAKNYLKRKKKGGCNCGKKR